MKIKPHQTAGSRNLIRGSVVPLKAENPDIHGVSSTQSEQKVTSLEVDFKKVRKIFHAIGYS